MDELQEHKDLLDEIDCRVDAKLDRIRKNLTAELNILPSSNPHATAARVAVNAMILAIGTELNR